MCGVFGGVGHLFSSEKVVEGLRELEYRGYDSWGVALARDKKLELFKDVGRVSKLPFEAETSLALGHTRWATHGGVTVKNAHPHLDSTGEFAVVHNGIIENAQELREKLKDVTFISQTDTEVAVHLYSAQRLNGLSVEDALQKTLVQLEGSSALVFLDTRASQLVVSSQGLPLLLGRSEGNYWVASDLQALVGVSKEFAVLSDGLSASLGNDELRVWNKQGQHKEVKWEPLPPSYEQKYSAGESAMWHEMGEQAKVIHFWSEYQASLQFSELQQKLTEARKIWLTGCGTAFHAAQWGVWEVQKKGWEAEAVLASEWSFHLERVQPDDLVLCFSQSGETHDLLSAIPGLRARGAFCAALINVPSSSLERSVELTIHLEARPEKAVASTKAFLAKLCVLWRLLGNETASMDEAETFLVQELPRAFPHLQELASLWKSDVAGCFVLGRGQDSVLAKEVALKIKEISYIHAEALPSSELKHGSLALVEANFPTLVLSSAPTDEPVLNSSMQEIMARDGQVEAWLSWKGKTLPHSPFAAQLCSVVLGQYLAYYLAMAKGNNPDRPRNLAKSVTVG